MIHDGEKIWIEDKYNKNFNQQITMNFWMTKFGPFFQKSLSWSILCWIDIFSPYILNWTFIGSSQMIFSFLMFVMHRFILNLQWWQTVWDKLLGRINMPTCHTTLKFSYVIQHYS
jgi:hypothetical protein